MNQEATVQALREMADADYSYENYEKLLLVAAIIECVFPGDWSRAVTLVQRRRSAEAKREGLA